MLQPFWLKHFFYFHGQYHRVFLISHYKIRIKYVIFAEVKC